MGRFFGFPGLGVEKRNAVAAAVSLAVSLAAALALVSCADGGGQGTRTAAAAVTDRPNPQLATAVLRAGSAELIAEIADDEIERTRGLMHRKELKDGRGMLFVFDSDQRLSFWMKNTRIPLSIAYILSDGTIAQILDLEPLSEQPQASDRSVRYALEVPRGWFGRAGVEPGDRVVIPPLR